MQILWRRSYGRGARLPVCISLSVSELSLIHIWGRLIYSVAAGIITGLVRIYSSYPEGVCFGILAANCMVGLLARFEQKHVYGTKYDKDQKTAM